MSITRLPSVLFEQAWNDYRRVCREDGLVSLNRFCESRDVPVQRLYEWLRRRNISVKEFQSRFSDGGNEEPTGNTGFVPVSVVEQPQSRNDGFCAEGIRIECSAGMAVSVDRMSLQAFSKLLAIINALH